MSGSHFVASPKPCCLPDVIAGNGEGLLLRADADRDVLVYIPYESFFHKGDQLMLVLDGNPVPVDPINPSDEPPAIVRRLPGPLAEGRHTVNYEVLDENYETHSGFPEQPLRIDRTAPGGTAVASLEFSQQVIDHGVTPGDLVADLLTATLPAWAGMEEGDWIEPYYQSDPLSGSNSTLSSAYRQVQSDELGGTLTIGIALEQLLAMGDGVRWFGYVLRDLAGNASAIRPPAAPLTLMLAGNPEDRLPGGAKGLAEGDFAEKNASNALNKALVQSGGGTPYRVKLDYLNVALDDRISLQVQGYDSLEGTGAQTPDTYFSDLYVLREEDLPTEEEPDKFHDFLIPTSYFASKWTTPVQGRGSLMGHHRIENTAGAAQAPAVMVRVAVADL